MIDGMPIKGKFIIIPFALQKQILDQLHNNHMGIKKMQLLVRKSLYWINVNIDIEWTVKQCATCLGYEQT